MNIFKLTQSFEVLFSLIHKHLLNRKKLISIARKTNVYYKCPIYNFSDTGKIIIGSNCTIGRSFKGYHGGMPFYTCILNDGVGSNIYIGNNTRINGAYIHSSESINIGDNCVIASGVNILDSNGHITYSLDRTVGRDTPKPIIIGNNVWIGINSIILKGTTIGNNSIISAGSVVKGVFPENSIISGNPAVLVKKMSI